jgi:hypothetical protein
MPEKWGGGRVGPLSRDGFYYDESKDDHDGSPLTKAILTHRETGPAPTAFTGLRQDLSR